MHFLTLLQASPQFLGSLLANAVGTMRATTRRRLARCIFLWIKNRRLQLEDLLHCTTLERSWEAGWWGLQARHSLHNFCGSALTQPTHLLAPPARLRNCCRAPHSFTPTNGALHCSTLKDLGQTTSEHIHLSISGTTIFIDTEWFSSIVPGLVLLATTDLVAVTKRCQGNVAFRQLHNSVHIIVCQLLNRKEPNRIQKLSFYRHCLGQFSYLQIVLFLFFIFKCPVLYFWGITGGQHLPKVCLSLPRMALIVL